MYMFSISELESGPPYMTVMLYFIPPSAQSPERLWRCKYTNILSYGTDL